jgi:hypothetical protein
MLNGKVRKLEDGQSIQCLSCLWTFGAMSSDTADDSVSDGVFTHPTAQTPWVTEYDKKNGNSWLSGVFQRCPNSGLSAKLEACSTDLETAYDVSVLA